MTTKIICRKRYDTDKSTLVYCEESPLSVNDFEYHTTEIYQTGAGDWFLVDQYHDSNKISVICQDKAYEYLESHSDDPAAMAMIELHFADFFEEA